jgi:hypothetical protein
MVIDPGDRIILSGATADELRFMQLHISDMVGVKNATAASQPPRAGVSAPHRTVRLHGAPSGAQAGAAPCKLNGRRVNQRGAPAASVLIER